MKQLMHMFLHEQGLSLFNNDCQDHHQIKPKKPN